MVLFFPHLCICQNSEWLKICWLGFSTHHQRQLAAISNVFFSEDEEQKSWENDFIFRDFSCCIFSHASMKNWQIAYHAVFPFSPLLAVTKFMNSIIAVDTLLLAQSAVRTPATHIFYPWAWRIAVIIGRILILMHVALYIPTVLPHFGTFQ